MLRLVGNDPQRVRQVLARLNLPMLETEVLVVELANQPGALATVVGSLAKAHVNIGYAYVTAGAPGARRPASSRWTTSSRPARCSVPDRGASRNGQRSRKRPRTTADTARSAGITARRVVAWPVGNALIWPACWASSATTVFNSSGCLWSCGLCRACPSSLGLTVTQVHLCAIRGWDTTHVLKTAVTRGASYRHPTPYGIGATGSSLRRLVGDTPFNAARCTPAGNDVHCPLPHPHCRHRSPCWPARRLHTSTASRTATAASRGCIALRPSTHGARHHC